MNGSDVRQRGRPAEVGVIGSEDLGFTYFQLPTSSIAAMKPISMSVRRDKPRHMTMFPGGGSFDLAK